MKSSLDENSVSEENMDFLQQTPYPYHKLKTENINTIEDVKLILTALDFSFQEKHPFFEQLKEKNLL